MAKQRNDDPASHDGDSRQKRPLKNLGISCMLNTEASAVLAVIRRSSDDAAFVSGEGEHIPGVADLLQPLRSLRSFVFQPGAPNWIFVEPILYLEPFLNIIQSSVPAAATGVALSSILKILKLGIFDETTPGAGDAVHTVVSGATKCRLEETDPTAEDAVLMRLLQVMTALLKHKAAILLSDCAVCTLVYTSFQIVRESSGRGSLLQRTARYAVHELVQTIFSRLPEVEQEDCNSNSENDEDEEEEEDEKEEDEDEEGEEARETGYGVKCMINIFQFLCSLLNVTEVREEGYGSSGSEEEMQLFALILINSSVELGGEFFGHHPKLLNIIQNDLFYHLVYHGARCSPLPLSMICSTVLNLYNFLRGSLRLQMEAFFSYVLQRKAAENRGTHLQEIAVEGIIGLCRQPSFAIEMYVNYDCDPIRKDIFEEMVRCLCRAAFPTDSGLSPMQFQAFQALVAVVETIAENIKSLESKNQEEENKPIVISEFKPFWMEKSEGIRDDLEAWVDFIRLRKFKKRKVLMAANHFNRDEKKGLEFLKISRLVPDTPDPQSIAFFFRYTPGLDKNKIGDYLGDPDAFKLKVLKEFALTFDFQGVILDTALRTFLETFRLPGESQKIQRILEAFSERFYEQQSSDMFVSMDAVFILCYSLIMLNTDQHNPQVKKKMTEEEFIRNNRAINGGKDLPRDYLSELFQSISNNAITLFAQSGSPPEMTRSRWIELMGRSKVQEPFILCDFNRKLCRDAFAAIAGPSTATLSAVFEHAEDDGDILDQCVEAFVLIAQISQHGLQDIVDEIILCCGKFTSLLNTYVTADETLFYFTNDLRFSAATFALFTMANRFGHSIRGGWSSILDCLLMLKKLKLLPQPLIESEKSADSPAFSRASSPTKSESAVFFSSSAAARSGGSKQGGFMGRFTQFLSLDNGAESLAEACGEFENNLKLVQRCQIGNIFSQSSKLPVEALLTLGRTLIWAAGGKGQNFSTSVDEEETVGVCWDLIVAISQANIDRFTAFWPQFHENFIAVTQLHEFSPCPFSEKAIVGIFAVCLKLFSRSSPPDKSSEELIFKSVNFIWKLDKVIIESCGISIAESVARLLMEHRGAIQTLIGWKTVLQLLVITGRHQETFSRCVEALMALMVEEKLISRVNYGFCVEAALGFAASKNSRLEESVKIIDLMADSVGRLVQWKKSGTGEKYVSISAEDAGKTGGSVEVSLFMKLVEALKKISLAKREEVRNHAVAALRRCFTAAAAELEFSPVSSMACFNNVVLAIVDDLLEKMTENSKNKGPEREREMRSIEGTLREALELSAEGMMLFLKSLHKNPNFRQLWLGFLRRMDTCVKAEVGQLKDLVPELLKKVIVEMKKKEILVQRYGDDLWETTNIQIQWIAPSLKEELFPEEF